MKSNSTLFAVAVMATGAILCAAPQAPTFTKAVRLKADGKFIQAKTQGYASPCWADVDGDGAKDLVVGQFKDGRMKVYKNLGEGKLAKGEWLQADGKIAKVPGIWCCTSPTPQFVDLNLDGNVDILSGSYSWRRQPMAGAFQLLLGTAEGTFKQPIVVTGSDDEPLVLPSGSDDRAFMGQICTRPTAVDLNDDGHLDIVSGNITGTFAMFMGLDKGAFEPQASWLMAGDDKLIVSTGHSDPCFVDWDQDGDLDMLSGSGNGGVALFINQGSKTKPAFAKPTDLVAKHQFINNSEMIFGDAHINMPGTSTRVFVADLNGDGKFDLLIGDCVTLNYPAKGLDPDEARAKIAVWDREFEQIIESFAVRRGESRSTKQQLAKSRATTKHHNARKNILVSETTGFVWVLYQK